MEYTGIILKSVIKKQTCLLSLGLFLFLVASVSATPRADRWRWSNPAPHGNHILDMQITSDFGVQVGDGGALHVQRSDERWMPVHTGVQNYLRGVAMLGDRIIAVGESGCIIWSDDTIGFQNAELNPPNTLDWFEGIAVSGQRAVAVGDYGAIYTLSLIHI